MEIRLENLGKQFNNVWIFRNLSATLKQGSGTVILGSNGSGKSTLLQLVSSLVNPTEGSVSYVHNGQPVPADRIAPHISIATPYMELIEEFTLTEMIEFHRRLRPLMNDMTSDELIRRAYLEGNSQKHIRHFSSGMKQRLKLALAIYTQSDILLLDEPVSNLDRRGIEWYRATLTENLNGRLLAVCSNSVEDEYFLCTEQIVIDDYKYVRKRKQAAL